MANSISKVKRMGGGYYQRFEEDKEVAYRLYDRDGDFIREFVFENTGAGKMTEQEAEALGMSDLEICFGILDEEIEPMERRSPMEKLHGKLVDRRCEAYHDVNVYEDGYEDYIYIGD